MVWLHMLDDEIVRLAASEGGLNILEPLVGLAWVNCVHDSHLLVKDDEGVVAHSFWSHILTLEQILACVVAANVFDCV